MFIPTSLGVGGNQNVNVQINFIQATPPKIALYSTRTFAKTAKHHFHFIDILHTCMQQLDSE